MTRVTFMSLLVCMAVASVAAAAGDAASPPSGAAAPADIQARLHAKQQELRECQDEIRQLESSLVWSDRMAAHIDRLLPESKMGWFWFVLGFGGEFVFFLRFVVQWWASERAARTVVPMMFWHLSLIGTALVLAYALYRIDPVFILAYSLNVFLYVRNMMIARRNPALEVIAEKTSE